MRAESVDIGEGVIGRAGHWVGNHAGLGPFHEVGLRSLLVDRQVAVQDTNATLPRHGDGHAGLGHGIHRARQQRHPQRDVAGDRGGGVGLARDHVRRRRQQQHVVVGEADHGHLVRQQAELMR